MRFRFSQSLSVFVKRFYSLSNDVEYPPRIWIILLAKEVSSLGLAFYVCSPSKTNCGSGSPKKVIDCAYKDPQIWPKQTRFFLIPFACQTNIFFSDIAKNSLFYIPEFCRKKTAESVTWTVKKIIVTVPLNGIHGLPQGLGALFQTWLTDYWFLINSTKILSSSSRVLNSELLNSWKPTTLRQKAEFIGLRKNNKDPTMFNFQAWFSILSSFSFRRDFFKGTWGICKYHKKS